MATVRHLETGVIVPLAARHLVGRSRSCQLKIDIAEVSAAHAEFSWDGGGWHLRDLASRNGTCVNGARIVPGLPVALAPGDEIGFGTPESQYRFEEGSAPRLIAFEGNETLLADDDMLCLPSSQEPAAMVYRDETERWMIETAEGTRPLSDQECVVVSGRAYWVHLPSSVRGTGTFEPMGPSPRDEGVLEFMVSRDGEHVELSLRQGDRVHPVEFRTHVLLLLELARARSADAAAGVLPEREHGWMYREALMKELRISDAQLLNLWVFRARQQFAQMKLLGASKVVERRDRSGQLRLGFRRLLIVDA